MNKFKNTILSSLLLAFTFFVVHDYVIEYSPNAMQNKVKVSQEHALTCMQCSNISAIELHDDIHTMLDTPIKHVQVIKVALLNTKPSREQFSSISYIGISPNKPPVI